MRIAVIGGGYVGLVSGACFAALGTDVTVVEADPGRLAALHAGQIPFYEPGLAELVAQTTTAGRLRFVRAIAEGGGRLRTGLHCGRHAEPAWRWPCRSVLRLRSGRRGGTLPVRTCGDRDQKHGAGWHRP